MPSGPTKPITTPAQCIALLDEPRRAEIRRLHGFIRRTVPALKPFVLGQIIEYGPFHYRYASGRQGDTAVVGLSSRKQYISLYICAAVDGQPIPERHKAELAKANIGRGCIRVKRADDLDFDVLKAILREAQRWTTSQKRDKRGHIRYN